MDYIKAATETLLPLSHSKDLKTAFLEWQYSGESNDRGELDGTCGICSTRIRYEFNIHNAITRHPLLVGSECVLKFDVVDDMKQQISNDLTRLKKEAKNITTSSVDLYTAQHGAVIRGQISAGHFGVSKKADLIDIGGAIDVLLLSRRPKAIDNTNPRKATMSFVMNSPTFQNIKQRSDNKDLDCKYGIGLVLFEHSHGFLEYFCSNPRSLETAGTAWEQFNFKDTQQPVRLAAKASGKWYYAAAIESSSPFPKTPSAKRMIGAIECFNQQRS